MFAFLGAMIDVRWARFGRENTRDASLLANDFMVDVICVQILFVKETFSCTAAEVWYCERPKPTVTAADDTSGSWGKPLEGFRYSVSRVKETGSVYTISWVQRHLASHFGMTGILQVHEIRRLWS